MNEWQCPINCNKVESYGWECPDDLLGDEPCPMAIWPDSDNKKQKEKGNKIMMKPAEWETTEAFTGDFKTITPGGHVCKILQARSQLTNTGKEQLAIMFDIAEGDCKDYYSEQHSRKAESNPDAKWQGVYRQLVEGNSLKFFKGMITAIEQSNNGYKWDWKEDSLRGKLFGGVFGQEEYLNGNGDVKLSTKLRFIRSVEQVRKGVEVPAVKKIQQTDMSGLGHDVPYTDEKMPWEN